MASATLIWWSFLCAVSLLNVVVWAASVAHLRRRAPGLDPDTRALLRLQMLLSAGYVLGCAYRSMFPVYDVQRLGLVDSWLSSVIVGLSVATLAEMCFAIQWALLLRTLARDSGSRFALWIAGLVVPMIALAELCSWHAVLTRSNLGHVIEETLWGLSAALLVAGFARVRPHCAPSVQRVLAGACVIGLAYVAYMFMVDVPMYWARWVQDEAQGRQYLSLAQGLADASQNWVVSHRWADWETEVVWMSLYFSVAVWLSMSLMHVAGLLGRRPGQPVAYAGAGTVAPASSLRLDRLPR